MPVLAESEKSVTSVVSSKGQVTVPIEVRRRLGVKEGDRIQFVVSQGNIFLRPVREGANPFLKQVGALPALADMGEVEQWLSDLRDDDDRRQDLDEP